MEKYLQEKEMQSAEETEKLPESFAIEYLNTGKITEQLSAMGFRFKASGPAEGRDDQVFIEGESINGDGTTITIFVTKGEKYESPQEQFREQGEKEDQEII